MLFLLTVLALTWNFVAVLMAVITVRFEHGATAAWFFAALYFVIGVPGAWFTWYVPKQDPYIPCDKLAAA